MQCLTKAFEFFAPGRKSIFTLQNLILLRCRTEDTEFTINITEIMTVFSES